MKALSIGSCVLDVYVEIDKLPGLGEDVNTRDLKMSLGGMAYNVYNILSLFDEGHVLGCAIGEGLIADIVAGLLKKRGHRPIGLIPGLDNGMCLCLVDDSKERSFISHHGAEYRFDPTLFENTDFSDIGWIYCSGLELEDVDGDKIISFLQQKNKNVFFAPGPRLHKLAPGILERMYRLHPLLHINQREASLITGASDIYENAEKISALTGNTVIITLGEQGTLLKEPGKEPQLIPSFKVDMLDSTGAGDNHAGSVLACLCRGMSCEDAVRAANKISSYVVRQKGASLTRENFNKAMEELKALNIPGI